MSERVKKILGRGEGGNPRPKGQLHCPLVAGRPARPRQPGILPGAQSVYRWEGSTLRQPESILLMETADDRVEHAMMRIEALHSYDVPKIVAVEGARVNTSYEQWVVAETKAS